MIRWVILLCFLCNIYAYTQEYTFQKFDVEQGLPSNVVYQLTQDRNGYVWVATSNGLCRYDGITFKTYTNDHIFSEDMPWLYHVNDRIYCSTWSGKSGYIKNDSLYSLYHVKSMIESRFFLADSKGGYWTTNSMEEVVHYAAGKTEVYNLVHKKAIYEDPMGNIYIYNPGLFYYEPASKKIIPVKKWDQHLQHDFSISGGLLISQTNMEECIIYKNIYNPEILMKLPLDKDETGPPLFIQQIIKNGPSEYWMHNYKNILVYDSLGQLKENITKNLGLTNIYINTMFRDRENNIWVGTRGQGLFLLRKKPVVNFISLKDHYISQLVANSSGDLLISHREGKMSLLDRNEKLYTYTIPHNSAISVFYGLHTLEDSFFGILEKQFFWINAQQKHLEVRSFKNSLKNIGIEKKGRFIGGYLSSVPWIYTYLLSGKGDVWLGTNKGLYILPAQESTGLKYTDTTNFKKNIIEKKNGSYSMYNEASSLKAYKINIQYPEQNNNTYIQQVIQDRQGMIWIATQCEGVYVYYQHKFYHLTQKQGLLSDNINTIYADDKNRVWVATNAGVSCIYPNGTISHITTEDGILSNQVNGVYVNKNDFVYVGTVKGLSKLDLNKTEAYVPYPPVITKIRVNEETLKTNDTNITLSYKQNNILVEYLSVNFNTRVKYAYTIEGLTSDWEITENRSIYLPKLSPGNYRLKIRSISQDGKESTGITVLHFTIAAPFWQWRSFWVISGIILCTIIYIISWYRKQSVLKRFRLRQKIQELEKKALLSQINPHFIFNCLTAIKYLIGNGEIQKADEYLHTFATLMRNTLDFSETKIISLREELSYIGHYIELERLRFSQFFQYKIDVQENIKTENLFLPPMLLQPYIENAIRHGLRPKKEGEGWLIIRFYTEGDYLIIKIDDNGIGRKEAAKFKEENAIHYQSKGMSISAQRATLQNIEIYIIDKQTDEDKPTGTEITIKIPQDSNN